MKMKKSIPALPVRNIGESVKFYSEKLGFEARHKEDGFAILVRDEVELHLWKSGDESWRSKGASLSILPICSGAESFLAGTASCRIEVQGIDELFMEYKAQGVVYDAATVVVEQPWGDREFPALDHHRNLLTFYEVMP
ncbi:bleomycin resistance family protein [Nibribacter ruber]|jgi:catechol 2,3-dioxygenase-like lactoylglutathione lyase family enzyme|uniref:Bleomycin resistance protein n=1 Tax=Nibribacter ruber TaxID=2698458 RepID=A0A6P1P043_9BACT|nr:VOC family protein [Nibribacter ruber]QHL87979.1 bleomycin resistance family protein [Nibribacter ruber]